MLPSSLAICTQLMIDVRENELKVEALKDELFRIGPCKEANCAHRKLNENIDEKSTNQGNPENLRKLQSQTPRNNVKIPQNKQHPFQRKYKDLSQLLRIQK
ncbi:hypothetical protein AVEN_215331-1 [Araneus ventricosus]|uniref:Uncharacterized protein n=1 Tax=Araneus ventricosus TaxID=182803 RepID=A0A4Y2GI22_ARAVE|nr:hypothetical protein AVEN_215331-1 [Araneus ventricosus]